MDEIDLELFASFLADEVAKPITKTIPKTLETTVEKTQFQPTPAQVRQESSLEPKIASNNIPASSAGMPGNVPAYGEQYPVQEAPLDMEMFSSLLAGEIDKDKENTGLKKLLLGDKTLGENLMEGTDAINRNMGRLYSAEIITTPLTMILNSLTGKEFKTPRQAIDNLLVSAGVPNPETKSEQVLDQLTGVIMETMSGISVGKLLSSGMSISQAVAPKVKGKLAEIFPNIKGKLAETLTKAPGAQLVGAGGGVAGSQVGEKAGEFVANVTNMSPEQTEKSKVIGNLVGSFAGDALATNTASKTANILNSLELGAPTNKQALLNKTAPYGDLTTTELTPPTTQKGVTMQKLREGVTEGVGELHQSRNTERVSNVKNLMADYGVELDELGGGQSFSEDIMNDYITTRSEKLTTNINAKKQVLNDLSWEESKVPVPTVTNFLDDQLAELGKRDNTVANQLKNHVLSWREGIQELDLATLEKTRKDFLQSLKGSNNETIASEGTQILDKAYSFFVEDMGNYIKANGNDQDYTKWRAANKELSTMASEFKDKALFSLLEEGRKNPENIRSEDIDKLVFSRNKSDMTKLMNNLSEEGKGVVRTAIISKFAEDSAEDLFNMSPAVFARKLQKYSKTLGVAFEGDEYKRLVGLKNYLDLTNRSEEFVRVNKGYSGLPTDALPGAGPVLSSVVRPNPIMGLFFSALGTTGIGKVSQMYEQTPAIRNLVAQMADLDPKSDAMVEAGKRLDRVIYSEVIKADQEKEQ